MDCDILFTINLYMLILYKSINTTGYEAISTLV